MEQLTSILKKYYLNIYIRNVILFSINAFFFILSNALDDSKTSYNFFSLLLHLVLIYGLVFFHNYVLLRNLLVKKKVIGYVLGLIAYFAMFCYLWMFGFPLLLNDPSSALNLSDSILSIFANTFIVALFYILHYYFLKYIKLKEIEAINIQNEMDYLKQQLNPHFLLNALNNLYSVSLTNPMNVSHKIIELSDLLKYQIETNKKDYNYLFDEKKFIEKYIEYSKWKLQNILILSNEIGEIKNYLITPMLFLPLIENAIKYSNFERNPVININWIFSNSKFIFTISNAFKENKNENFSTQTGLKNLKKRLQLFHPESNLEIIENNNNFTVNLTLWNLNTLV